MSKMPSKHRYAIAAFAGLAITLAGCSGPPSGEPTSSAVLPTDLDELIELAQSEDAFVVYGNVTAQQGEGLLDEFAATYDLDADIQYNRFTSAELLQRFQAEAASGRVLSDFIFNAYPSLFEENPDLFTTITPELLPNLADYPAQNVTDLGVRYSVSPFAIHYNNELLSEDEVPHSWEDLADERFRGQIILNDPRTNPAYNVLLHYVQEEHGSELLEAIGNSDYQLTNSSVNGIQILAAGGASVMLPVPNVGVSLPPEAPVGFVIPEGTAFVAESWWGLPSQAANPAIAALFANWLLGAESREFACGSVWSTAVNDAATPGASGCPVLENVQSITDPAEVAKVPEYEQEIYELLKVQ